MAEFEVKLESEPTGDVVLGVVSSDATEGAVSASSLTFTATTWSTAQTVTLTGVDDSTVDGNQNYTVTLTVDRTNTVDANYDALSAVTVYARNADNEYGLDVSSVTGQATEAGGTATFTVALNTRPTAAVTVSVSSRDTSEGAASPSSLTFAATAWNTAQTVTVTGADDAIDDGTVTWAVRLDPSSGDANYNGLSNVNVLVTTTDDDAAPPPPSLTATLSLSPSSISENGGVATVTATLTRASSAATTVTVTPVSGSYTVAPGTGATIVIAAGSTTSADTATITAVDNDVDAADSDVTVVGTASNSQGAGTVAGASLTITDDDTAGFAVSPTPSTSSRLRTTESGGMAEFEVKLESEPTGDVVLGVVSSDATEGTVSPTSLTFTATTWNTEQTVTLTGVDDAPVNPADGDRNYTVTVTVDQTSTVDANYDALSAVTVYAVNVDNESGLDVSAVTGQATEPGGTATFTVALVAQPSAAVTVTVTSRDTSEGTASPTSLTFETSDWSTAQTVTVTGVDDDVDDGDVTWAVRLDPSSGGDANYDGLDDEDVSVTTTDDDAAPTARLVLTPSTIDEGGTANTVATVTATLSRPSVAATTVTVTAAPVSPAVTGDYTLTGTTLTIAAGSMAGVGTVTVAAKNNDVDAADKTVTVSGTAHNARAAADSMTVAVTPAMLTIADDDEKGVVLTPSELVEVTESGAPVAYTVALTSEPVGEVTVTVAAEGNAFLSVTPPNLNFTATDWRQAQTVTLTAKDDGNDVAESSSLSHTASGGGYGEVSGSLPVSVEGESAVRVSGAPGTTTYIIERRRVEVVVKDRVPGGIEVDLAGLASGPPLTLTFGPPADNVPMGSSRFSLGPEGSRTVVDIAVSEMLSGLKVCLPVEEGLSAVAGDRTLLLLHHDGSAWESVPGAEATSDGTMVCASMVMVFSPFAVGWENNVPTWEGVEPVELGPYVAGSPLPGIVLPAAKGGDEPLAYTLAGPDGAPLPEWLTFDGDGKGEEEEGGAGCPDKDERALCGTSPEGLDTTELHYTLVATDKHGDRTEPGLAVEIAIEKDLAPTFGGASVAPQLYTLGEEIKDLTLPKAKGGNRPLKYELTPALPSGLSFDLDGAGACGAARTLCGTPTEVVETPKTYTWTAEDRDGDKTEPPVGFTIEVEEGRAKARERLARINRSVLPELSRASWDSWTGAVTGRLESSVGGGGSGGSGEGLTASLAGFLRANEQALEEDGESWKELLSGQSFAVALGGEGEGAETGIGRPVTVWGAGDRRHLSRDVPSLKWSGELFAAHLGADADFGSGGHGRARGLVVREPGGLRGPWRRRAGRGRAPEPDGERESVCGVVVGGGLAAVGVGGLRFGGDRDRRQGPAGAFRAADERQ